MTGPLHAIVLAAGFGTRLGAETADVPKPLVDIAGRPALDRLLDRVGALDGLDRIVVVANARFADRFAAWADGSPHGGRVAVVDDGAATVEHRRGAVADMLLGLDAAGEGPSLVVAGDNLIDQDLAPFRERFEAVAAPLVLCRHLGSEVPPSTFGEVTVDAGGVIVGFREKPPDPSSPLTATCTYFLPDGVSADTRSYLEAGGDRDSPGRFVGWLAGRRRVHVAVLGHRYFDVGTPETLARARLAFRD